MALTVAEAADQWLRAKPAAVLAEREVREAAEVLVAWFERTGKSTYRNRVGMSVVDVTNLDTRAVRADHGDRYDVAGKRRTLSDLRAAKAKAA